MTAGSAVGELGGTICSSETGTESGARFFESDMFRLARIGTTAEVRRMLRCSISCRARLAENSLAGGTKWRTASNGEAGGGVLQSVVLPSPKNDDLRLDGAGRSRDTGADIRRVLVSYIEFDSPISLGRRDQEE